jgi:nitroreductase
LKEQGRRHFLKTGMVLGAGAAMSGLPVAGTPAETLGTVVPSLFDVIHSRRSVRSYLPTPVPDEHIIQICDAARMAPTSGNQQPWKFLVVRRRAKIDELMEACKEAGRTAFKARQKPSEEDLAKFEERIKTYFDKLAAAPVFIVVLVDMQSKYPSYNRYDGPLAAGFLMLAARALGYGTVFFTDSIPDRVTREVFHIPDRYQRVCITPIGVPAEWPATPAKKELADMMVYESF